MGVDVSGVVCCFLILLAYGHYFADAEPSPVDRLKRETGPLANHSIPDFVSLTAYQNAASVPCPVQIPTAQPGFVPNQIPTAQPALVPGMTPMPGITYRPGLQLPTTPASTSHNIVGTGTGGGVQPGSTHTGGGSARIVHPSTHQLRQMFESKGGHYIPEYMATTQEEAVSNFQNLLTLTTPAQAATPNISISAYENYLTKAAIMDDLDKLHFFLTHPSGGNVQMGMTMENDSKITTDEPAFATSHPSTPIIGSVSTKTITIATPKTTNAKPYASTELPKKTGTTDVPNRTGITMPNVANGNATKHVDEHTKRTDQKEAMTTFEANTSGVRVTPTVGNNHYATRAHSATTENDPYSTTLDPKVLSGLAALLQYVHGEGGGQSSFHSVDPDRAENESGAGTQPGTALPDDSDATRTKRYADLDRVWREAATSVHPETLIGLTRGSRRQKRNADGSYTQENYCQMKGSRTADGQFLHMCSTCAVTTRLSEDYFPRYINEALCKTSDGTCMVVGPTAHGACKQRTFTLNILRRRHNTCLLVNHNNGTYVMEDWQLHPRQIRVSCECTINKNSVFRQYVGANLPGG